MQMHIRGNNDMHCAVYIKYNIYTILTQQNIISKEKFGSSFHTPF